MTEQQKWGTDRDTHFDTARITKRNTEKISVVETAGQPEKKPCYKPVKPNPAMVLVHCFGVALLHGLIQAAIYYVFSMGSIDAYGAMMATMANAAIGGWRVCWRFKV